MPRCLRQAAQLPFLYRNFNLAPDPGQILTSHKYQPFAAAGSVLRVLPNFSLGIFPITVGHDLQEIYVTFSWQPYSCISSGDINSNPSFPTRTSSVRTISSAGSRGPATYNGFPLGPPKRIFPSGAYPSTSKNRPALLKSG